MKRERDIFLKILCIRQAQEEFLQYSGETVRALIKNICKAKSDVL